MKDQIEKRIKLAKYAFGQIPDQKWVLVKPLPNYFNDLNAVHELEKEIWAKEWDLIDDFCDHLALVIDPVHGYNGLKIKDALQATAAQRAEAIGLTLNLWK
jgi:hypothetical protein